jgi:polyvinyl alcohol dehydrogenase (cytochrome)
MARDLAATRRFRLLRLAFAWIAGLTALSCTQLPPSVEQVATPVAPANPAPPAAAVQAPPPVQPPPPIQPPAPVQPPPIVRPEAPIQGTPQSVPALVQLGYAPHPGQAIYEKNCGICHNSSEATRSPALEALQRMRHQTIDYALTEGKMQVQGAALSAAQRSMVIEYLVGKPVNSEEWIAGMLCKPQRQARPAGNATVTGFGFDARNQRRLTSAQSGLRGQDFERLELAWAMAFPGATAMRSQPAVVGSTLFLPVADAARLFAIDISQPAAPCLKWTYDSGTPLRTSAAFGKLKGSGRSVLVFGDLAATVHMVDAETGAALWKQRVAISQYSVTTGTPVLHEDRVYVPISQYEIGLGANNDHECCKSHGAVTALDAATGNKIWTADTMPDAKPVRDRGDGKMLWGPSGAPIWNSPAIDARRGVLYVGTGEATSEPAAKTTDAILAIDLKDGSIRWSFQATENDIFLVGCGRNSKALNCPRESVSRDVDFGASVVIARRADGTDILLAGQKSGTLWALDPDEQGKVLWRRDFGEGSALGGIHWGIAVDGARVFAPINRPYGRPAAAGDAERSQKPGINAVNVDTGELLWSYAPEPDCSGERQTRIRGCSNNIGMSAAPLVVDGVVVSGSLDGFLRAFDGTSGKLLFQFDTARPFDTINGVNGSGGALDNATMVAANGYLFVGSGYGLFGQTPGNVLLAFRPKR